MEAIKNDEPEKKSSKLWYNRYHRQSQRPTQCQMPVMSNPRWKSVVSPCQSTVNITTQAEERMQQGKEWRWALEKLTSKKNTGETLTRSLYIPIHITWRKILKVLMPVRISQQSRQTKNPGRKQTNKNNNDLNKQDKFGTPSVGRRFHSPPKNHYCDHFTRKSWRNSCLLLYICSEKLNACSLRKGLGAVLYLYTV